MKTSSKAHASNVIKINIGDLRRKKKKRSTRKRRTTTEKENVMFQSVQPHLPTGVLSHLAREKADEKTKQANDLLVKALTDTNSNVLKLATSIAKPSYTNGHTAPPLQETPVKPPKSAKPQKDEKLDDYLQDLGRNRLIQIYKRQYGELNFGNSGKKKVIEMLKAQGATFKEVRDVNENILPPENHPNINTRRGGSGDGGGGEEDFGLGGLGFE